MQLATQHTTVTGRPGRLVLDMRQPKRSKPSAAFPWALIHLSTRMTAAATATIQGGSFWIGENAAVTLATSTRTITANLQYLWLEYNFDTNALTAASPSTTLPVSASPVFVLPLAKVSFNGTGAAITDYLYLGGDFHLPGTWAA